MWVRNQSGSLVNLSQAHVVGVTGSSTTGNIPITAWFGPSDVVLCEVADMQSAIEILDRIAAEVKADPVSDIEPPLMFDQARGQIVGVRRPDIDNWMLKYGLDSETIERVLRNLVAWCSIHAKRGENIRSKIEEAMADHA